MGVKVNSESILGVLNKSGKSVLSQRASSMYSDLKMAEDSYVREKKMEVERISAAIREHMDLSVNNTQALTLGQVDSDEWVERLHELHMDLRNAKVELEVAMAVDTAVFPEIAAAQGNLMEM